ncbi:MAG: hypothetical protein J5I91_04490 [Bacteroidetes bacterium]|nr:hypothetical protein [Bacteroidota bacterium]
MMKNMFKNPWAKGGEYYPEKVLENNVSNNLVTGLPNVILEDKTKNKFEVGVESLLRLKVEGLADNSWGGVKYNIELIPSSGITLTSTSYTAEKGWILETKLKGSTKGNLSIGVKVNKTVKNNIPLIFYEVDKSPKMLSSFGTNGFTLVKKSDGELISIPIYYKVSEVRFIEDETREEFLMLEWPFINVRASVKCETKGKSRFVEPIYETGAKIFFNKAKGELKYGNVKISAYTDPTDPIPNGTHNIWLPDYSHPIGDSYLSYSKYALIWFRLGNESSDRYLHVGSVSLGCVSVGKSSDSDNTPEFSNWTSLYNYLSKKRSGNKFIGEIVVS